jgi:hypothetical protein
MDAPNSQFVRVQLSGMSGTKSSRQQSVEEDGNGKEGEKAASSRRSPVTTGTEKEKPASSRLSPVTVRRESDPGFATIHFNFISVTQDDHQVVDFTKTACNKLV